MKTTPGTPWVCKDCGYRINGGVDDDLVAEHECDERSVERTFVERFVEQATEQLHESFGDFLASPDGRLEVYLAQKKLGLDSP